MSKLGTSWRGASLTIKLAIVSGSIVVVGAIGNALESQGATQVGLGPIEFEPSTTLSLDTSTSLVTTTTTPATTTVAVTTSLPVTTTAATPTTTIAALRSTTTLATTTTRAVTTTQANCHPSYRPCVPIVSDVDCIGGSGNGPYYTGRVEVVGPDVYDLDRDNDGIGCEG